MKPSQQALDLLISIFPDRKEEVLEASSFNSVELSDNGHVHGALIYTVNNLPDVNYVFVCWIGVKNRGRGNGKRLITALTKEYSQYWVTLAVHKDNTDARKFYEACGFINAGLVHGSGGYLRYQRKPRRS